MEYAMDEFDFDITIFGEPASGKNSRRIVSIGGKPRLIKSKKAIAYSKDFDKQCPVLENLIEGSVAVWMDVYYASRRPDLATELILDLLQGRIIKNDRQVKTIISLWNLDRENPRCRIRLKTIELETSTGLSSYKLSKILGTSMTEEM
jgi:hypothetical protein